MLCLVLASSLLLAPGQFGLQQVVAPPAVARPTDDGAPIRGVHLIALNVASLEASLAWYRNNLGFVVRSQKEFPKEGMRIVMLESDGLWLEIVEKRSGVSPATIQRRLPEIKDWDEVHGIRKVAFIVRDLDEIVQRLKEKQVSLRTSVMGDRSDSIFGRSIIVLDNEGNWIQLCELAGHREE